MWRIASSDSQGCMSSLPNTHTHLCTHTHTHHAHSHDVNTPVVGFPDTKYRQSAPGLETIRFLLLTCISSSDAAMHWGVQMLLCV